MAYDEDLADRLRELLAGETGVSEQQMFGGLAFLIEAKMAISASGQGGILVRVDPADSDRLVASTDAELAIMGGRTMGGWLRVAPEHLRTKRQLAPWVRRGVDYARSLPAKRQRRTRR
jgi:TfoX/Sxy family transcriptional regulator of competence genes